MQETFKERKVSLNIIEAIIIFVIICINTDKSLYYTPGPFKHWIDYLPFLLLNFCAFLCSLILQLEEILEIYRNRKSLLIRRELAILGFICFIFGIEKYLCLLLIPLDLLRHINSAFLEATLAVFFAGNIDIVFMFVAGISFVRAFGTEENPIESKQRKRYFKLYLSLVFFIILMEYLRVWMFVNFYGNAYIYNIVYIVFICICSFVLQAEQIAPIVNIKKKTRWEFIALSGMALFLTIVEIWMMLHLYESPSSIIQKVIGSDLWQIAYSFAAGMFFVRAFRVDYCKLNGTMHPKEEENGDIQHSCHI